MDNKNTLRILLALAILIAFFLPWFKGGGSGLDIVMAKNAYDSSTTTQIVRYSFLLIPFFALIVLIRSVSKQGSGFLVRLLPFLVTALLTALFIIGVKNQGGGNEELRGWFQMLDYGFFINVVASFILIFV